LQTNKQRMLIWARETQPEWVRPNFCLGRIVYIEKRRGK
jgi:hypothetical protein